MLILIKKNHEMCVKFELLREYVSHGFIHNDVQLLDYENALVGTQYCQNITSFPML